MMDKSFEYDEIGDWSQIKLEIVRKYATAYTTILSKKSAIKKYIYIDAFAGAGTHISKATGEFVMGSPLNALNVTPPFSEIHLIDLDGGKTTELRRQAGSRQDVYVYEGDANDPYSLNVDWTVLQTAGQMGTIEVFYNFMIMDANMNVLWRDPQNVSPAQAERMDKVWGDRSWRDAAYIKQLGLFGGSSDIKTGNEVIAEGFRKRLEQVAGFKYVPKPIPMRNERGSTIYYLFFASPNEHGAHIVEDIFNKYRARGTS
jgi:hypothetical protein